MIPLAPYCVFSQSFFGCEDCAITSAGDFHMHPPFHHLPHLKETCVKITTSDNNDVFFAAGGTSPNGSELPTKLVSGLLFKAEKVGAISQRMTKEHNNIQQTQEE